MEKMEGKFFPLGSIMPPTHSADTHILAKTIASTDSLVRRLRQEQEEGSKQKSMIETMRKTSMKIHKMYMKEKEKNERNEEVNRGLREEIEGLKRQIEAQNNEMINLDCVHRQTLAEIQESAGKVTKSQQKVFIQLVREYLGSVGKLEENDLLPEKGLVHVRTIKGKLGKFPWLKEVLREFQSPEKKVKRGRKKRVDREVSVESSSDTDVGEIGSAIESFVEEALGSFDSAIEMEVSEPVSQKIFCDKGTMTTSITVTRGTNTEDVRQTADASTLFPEFNPMSYEEIFQEMIVDVPEMIGTIPNVILRDVGVECDLGGKEMVNAETLTDLCNIRKGIGYRNGNALASLQVSSLSI
uniref:Uncharacterized protein n=1 Tax=Phlebotomus papatasi TaxID=29031 RepID=A0A1B0DAK8_PHLPP